MSAENSCYSLSGAKYGVYYGGKLCYTMTTDANGACTLDNVLAADYTVKEISASKGFAVDVSSYNCKVKNEQTADVAVTEIPKNNPVSLMRQKGDKETGKAEPQGGATLEGAVYEIKYFKHKDGSTSLDRTWRVVTDDEGKANLVGTGGLPVTNKEQKKTRNLLREFLVLCFLYFNQASIAAGKAISSRQSAFCILPEASPTMEAGPPGNPDSYHPCVSESRSADMGWLCPPPPLS